MLELIEVVWKREAAALRNRAVCFAWESTCVRLTRQRVETIEEGPISKIPIGRRKRTLYYPMPWLDTAALFKCGKNYITFQNSRGFKPRLWVVKCSFASAYRYLRKRTLKTNHEEADMKICHLLHHAVQSNYKGETVCKVCSSSSDIELPVILLANEMPNLFVYVDNGAGKNRKVLNFSSCSLFKDQKEALFGMLAFTGNDYVLSFCGKRNRYAGN